jgi:hypothetical protein
MFDVAHDYRRRGGDNDIVTGAIPGGADQPGNDTSSAFVIIKAYRKDANGHDVLAWVNRARVKGVHHTARIDKVSFDRTMVPGGERDAVTGQLIYGGELSGSALMVTWSDGTTSQAALEVRSDGTIWFAATHLYNGGAPVSAVALRLIDTATTRVLGSYAITPADRHGANPHNTPPARPHSQRHGDARPAGGVMTMAQADARTQLSLSDMGLMFGVGALGAGARKARAIRRGDDAIRLDDGSARFWADPSLADGYRRVTVDVDGRSAAPLADAHLDDDWLVEAGRVTSGAERGRAWQAFDHDDWLVVSERNLLQPRRDAASGEGGDWVMIGR